MSQITVIIPAYNESELIDECLQSLLDQTHTDFKALIIDDASTDDTKSRIQKYCKLSPQRIELLEFGKVGPGRARNLAAAKAQSEWIAFMDADCRATPDWLFKLNETYHNFPQADSVGGPHRAPPESSEFQWSVEKFFRLSKRWIDFFQKDGGNVRECLHNPLCNTSYRRDLFLKFSGFREDLFPGEDIELDLRLRESGYRIFHNPEALVFHHRPENIERFRNVMFAYGRAQGKLVRERGIERKIQWLGILLIIPGLFMFARPSWNNFCGILINSLQWTNGFIYGFRTNRSDPPGMGAPTTASSPILNQNS